jgi:hypothetical protein
MNRGVLLGNDSPPSSNIELSENEHEALHTRGEPVLIGDHCMDIIDPLAQRPLQRRGLSPGARACAVGRRIRATSARSSDAPRWTGQPAGR